MRNAPRVTPARVFLEGELEIGTVNDVERQLEAAIESLGQDDTLEIHLEKREGSEGVSYIDSSGTRALISVAQRLPGRVVVFASEERPLRVLEVMGLGEFLEVRKV